MTTYCSGTGSSSTSGFIRTRAHHLELDVGHEPNEGGSIPLQTKQQQHRHCTNITNVPTSQTKMRPGCMHALDVGAGS